jgi:protein-tyrosine-phosphatase
MAAAFFRERTNHLDVEVLSAGVANVPPVPPPWEARQAALELDIDISDHRALHLGAVDLTQADLVLGFELNHCAAAVVEGNAPPEKTFGLLELLRILDPVPAPLATEVLDGARQAIAYAHAQRSESGRFVPHEYVPDPIGGPIDVYRETARSLRDLCDQLVVKLFENSPARYVAG